MQPSLYSLPFLPHTMSHLWSDSTALLYANTSWRAPELFVTSQWETTQREPFHPDELWSYNECPVTFGSILGRLLQLGLSAQWVTAVSQTMVTFKNPPVKARVLF